MHGAKELRTAKRRRSGIILSDACAKGWLAAVEGVNAVLQSEGIGEDKLPHNFRGQLHLLRKYEGKEQAKVLLRLRAILHIAGYYRGPLEFGALGLEDAQYAFEDLKDFLDRIETGLK